MAKIKSSLQLTRLEIDRLLSSYPRCRIATLGPVGDINLTPMTFGWSMGNVYIFGRGQKVANLRRASTATILVDVGSSWNELKGVMMRGDARVLETEDEEMSDEGLALAKLNIGEKHGLAKDGEIIPYAATASGRSRRWIVFTPRKMVSWDNEKLDH